MADFLLRVKQKIRELYEEDSFSWFDGSYIVDW